MLATLEGRLAAMLDHPTMQQDPVSRTRLQEAERILSQPTLDGQHRLKVAIPIVPTILSYETEIDLAQSADLLGAWDKVKA